MITLIRIDTIGDDNVKTMQFTEEGYEKAVSKGRNWVHKWAVLEDKIPETTKKVTLKDEVKEELPTWVKDGVDKNPTELVEKLNPLRTESKKEILSFPDEVKKEVYGIEHAKIAIPSNVPDIVKEIVKKKGRPKKN